MLMRKPAAGAGAALAEAEWDIMRATGFGATGDGACATGCGGGAIAVGVGDTATSAEAMATGADAIEAAAGLAGIEI